MRYALSVAASMVLACNATGGPSDRKAAPSEDRTAGQLVVQWNDSAGVAHWSAPAEARWCARDTLLEIIAVKDDSGVGLALYARDSLRAEGYPVFQSGMFAPWRPQATAAVRLLTPNALKGFESASGQVIVTEGGSRRVSGRLDLRAKLASGPDSLHLTGSFDRLTILPAPAFCGRANKPATR